MDQHEQSRPEHIPTFNEVNAAYNEIAEHNEQHASFGAGLANIFEALTEKAEPANANDSDEPIILKPTSDKFDENIEKKVTEGDMHGELQGILHDETFLRIGLRMLPFGSHMAGVGGERTTSTSLVPMIENTELFTEFLSTINPDEVEVSASQVLLPAVLGNLRRGIAASFDPRQRESLEPELQEVAAQYGENALRTFIALAPEYKRLGLDDESLRQKHAVKPEDTGYMSLGNNPTQEEKDKYAALDAYNRAQGLANTYETLEKYVTYWGRDILPEFIVADSADYLTEPAKQRFGPSQWHGDGGQRHWRPALEFVAELGEQERTKEFGEEVRHGLVHSLDTAIGEIDGHSGDKPLYYAAQRDDLLNVRNALSGQPFDAARLEDYIKEPDYSV